MASKEDAYKRFAQKSRNKFNLDVLSKGILDGDLASLSHAITLAESTLQQHHQNLSELLEALLPHTGKSIRVGITGVPGVGKSTFIESFGLQLCEAGHKVAVLAIDPSSSRTRGSILGDKTRMEELTREKNAFIRPSPSSGALGGVANATRETILLCEAAGFDVILVETVGVGQSEVLVREMVDFFLLLMLAGAGDELQGIKRGIMEMADLLIINKVDGDNVQKAKRAKAEYQNALHLFPLAASKWSPKVKLCSALQNEGLEAVWKEVLTFQEFTRENGFWDHQRKRQQSHWFHATLTEQLKHSFYSNPEVKSQIFDLEKAIAENKSDPYHAAQDLIKHWLKKS